MCTFSGHCEAWALGRTTQQFFDTSIVRAQGVNQEACVAAFVFQILALLAGAAAMDHGSQQSIESVDG